MNTQATGGEARGVDAAECIVVPIATSNDRNGNPRRCYLVVHSEAGYVAAIDEGYHGPQAIDGELGPEIGAMLRSRICGRLNVAPKTYRDALKRFGFKAPERRPIFLEAVQTAALPTGWHEQKDGTLVCTHRDVSVCDECASSHPQVVEVLGAHFWIADAVQREEVRRSVEAKVAPPFPPAAHS